MTEIVRYNYRLRPGAQAQRMLMAEWDRCRWLWNEMVRQLEAGRPVGRGRLCSLLTIARGDLAWLQAGSQNAQEATVNSFVEAAKLARTVRGHRRPKLERKGNTLPSLGYTRNGFALVDGKLRLPKGLFIPVVWSRSLPNEPTSCRVYRDSLGHWYVSFVVRRDPEPVVPASGGVGIDWGVSTTATASDERFDLPWLGHRTRCAAELARAQRKMARRARPRGHAPSKGYEQAKRAAAKVAKKAQRQTAHEAQVWAQKVVSQHDLIAIEDFRPKFLSKTTMAKKAADAAITATKRELIQRGQRAGRKVVLVPPAYTTRTCSHCFARNKQPMGLGQRVFLCEICGHTEGRDRNAARVILAMAERVHASADEVRHVDGLPEVVDAHSELESFVIQKRR